jgi:hypothetical protein
MGIPQPNGAATSGSNHFGQDGIWDYKPANMCPISGGYWYDGTNAGDWTLSLSTVRSDSYVRVGGRSALYP